jgi:O-antigen/teichoic acid export membrane protein
MNDRMESHNIIARLKSKGLFAQILHYTLTVVFIRGLQVLLTPVITRLLPPAEYGYSVIFLQSVNLISGVAVFGLSAALTQVYLRRRDDFADTLKSVVLFVVVANVMLLPFLPWAARVIADTFVLPVALLYYAGPVGVVLGSFTLLSAVLIAEKRSLAATRYSILNVSGAGLLFILFLLAGERTYLARVHSYAIIVAILLMATMREFAPTLRRGAWSWLKLRWALRYGLPTIFSGISFILFTYADRVLLTRYRSAEEMGLYSFVCVIGLLPLLLSGSALTAFGPHLYARLNAGDLHTVKQLSHRMSLAVVLLCLLVAFLARPLAMFMADASYQIAVPAIPILALYSFAYYTMTYSATYLLYHEATAALSGTYIFALVVNIALNLAFIPKYGYIAAAWTTLAAGVLHALLVVALARLRYHVHTTGALLNIVALLLGCVALVVWQFA